MTRRELYIQVIKNIIEHHSAYLSNKEEVEVCLDLNGLSTTLELLSSNLLQPNLKRFIDALILVESDELEEDISVYAEYKIERDEYRKQAYKRTFSLYESDLTVFNCETLFYSEPYIESLIKALEKICYNESFQLDFLNFLASNTDSTNKYYIIYKECCFTNKRDNWQIYSYALFKYTNKEKMALDSRLMHTPASYCLSASTAFDKDVEYEQYYDIYDVLSEYHHSYDVLTAFLKMYQILEYIVYRKDLVAIVESSVIKQSFVRQVKGLDAKYGKNEREMFKNIFSIIGSIQTNFSSSDITPDIESFCTAYYPRNRDGSIYIKNISDISLAKFIYDTRCSIVHNKESEFHMTYANYDEYKSIIPLMNKLIGSVRDKVSGMINDKNSCLKFSSSQLSLY